MVSLSPFLYSVPFMHIEMPLIMPFAAPAWLISPIAGALYSVRESHICFPLRLNTMFTLPSAICQRFPIATWRRTMHVAADVYQLAIVSHYVLVIFDCPLPLVRGRNESVDAGAFPRRGGAE